MLGAVRPIGRSAAARGDGRVSFIKRAQEAAEAARLKAIEGGRRGGRADAPPTRRPRTRSTRPVGRRARARARRSGWPSAGVTTVIERIDPGTLAELIIKATALQEMTNKSLRMKGSPYRISEISISASIPPAVSFAIQRLDDEPEEVGGDGRLVERARRADRRERRPRPRARRDDGRCRATVEATPGGDVASPGAMPPSSVSRSDSYGKPFDEERLDLLDRAGRALAGRALGDLDAAGGQRARRDGQDPGHARAARRR